MADPLESLRLPDAPIAPRAAFAADLRRRVTAALGLTPTGATMSDATSTTAVPDYRPAGYHSVTTYITTSWPPERSTSTSSTRG